MKRTLKMLVSVLIVGLFIVGCGGEEGETVESLLILSAPIYDSNFDQNGRFSLSVLPLTADSTVIELDNADQIEFEVDSVTTARSIKQTYTITAISVIWNAPAADVLAVGLLLDSSGSMSWNDPSRIRVDAAKDFIKMLLGDDSSHMASVADFGAGAGEEYYFRLLQAYVNVSDTINLFAAIDMVTESGGTPLYTGVHHDLNYTDSTVSASNYGRSLLVLTDGEDNDSYIEDSLGAVIDVSQQYDIPVCVIGLGTGVYEADLKRLASETGCVYAHASDALALQTVFTALGLGLSQGYNTTTAEFDPVPVGGTVIFATVTVTSGGESASATIVFDIPD